MTTAMDLPATSEIRDEATGADTESADLHRLTESS
jgi:hypothetical protein